MCIRDRGKAEALEFRASETTRHLGETLLDIQLKPEILIACITHKGRTIIPRGSDVFQAGDTVICLLYTSFIIIKLQKSDNLQKSVARRVRACIIVNNSPWGMLWVRHV